MKKSPFSDNKSAMESSRLIPAPIPKPLPAKASLLFPSNMSTSILLLAILNSLIILCTTSGAMMFTCCCGKKKRKQQRRKAKTKGGGNKPKTTPTTTDVTTAKPVASATQPRQQAQTAQDAPKQPTINQPAPASNEATAVSVRDQMEAAKKKDDEPEEKLKPGKNQQEQMSDEPTKEPAKNADTFKFLSADEVLQPEDTTKRRAADDPIYQTLNEVMRKNIFATQKTQSTNTKTSTSNTAKTDAERSKAEPADNDGDAPSADSGTKSEEKA